MGTVVLGACGIACGLTTGNWVPLQKIGFNSNKIIGGFKLFGVGVTKILNKVDKNWNIKYLQSIKSCWYDYILSYFVNFS